jgi:hypothetical protein
MKIICTYSLQNAVYYYIGFMVKSTSNITFLMTNKKCIEISYSNHVLFIVMLNLIIYLHVYDSNNFLYIFPLGIYTLVQMLYSLNRSLLASKKLWLKVKTLLYNISNIFINMKVNIIIYYNICTWHNYIYVIQLFKFKIICMLLN